MSHMSASNRVALVTGGARRIGGVICRTLAAEGWTVIIHYNRSHAEAEDLAQEINKSGGRATTIGADLSSPVDVQHLVVNCLAQHGGLDLLVNNAAAFERDDITDLCWESFDRHLAVNLRAPLFLSRDFARAPGTGG